MAQCPHCQAPDAGGGAFCANCGQPVGQAAAPPAVAPQVLAHTPPPQAHTPPPQMQAPPQGPAPMQPPYPGAPGGPVGPAGPGGPGGQPYGQASYYGQPQKKKASPVAIWAIAFVGTLVIVLGLMFTGIMPNPFAAEPAAGPGPQQPSPQNNPQPKTQPSPQTKGEPAPAPNPQPANQPVAGPKGLEMIPDPNVKGTIDGRWDLAASYGPMLVVTQEDWSFPFDVAEGYIEPLFEFSHPESGMLIDLVVADAYNDGDLAAFVLYENKVLLMRHSGDSQWIDAQANMARIADFNGDGYNEVLFHEIGEDGRGFYELWQYVNDGSQRLSTVLRPTPPATYPSPVRGPDKDYLLGYDAGDVVLYGFDSKDGLLEAARFELLGTDPIYWLAGDSEGTVYVTRMGDGSPYLELYDYERGSDDWTYSGGLLLPGQVPYAAFTFVWDSGEDGLMLLSTDGNYLIY